MGSHVALAMGGGLVLTHPTAALVAVGTALQTPLGATAYVGASTIDDVLTMQALAQGDTETAAQLQALANMDSPWLPFGDLAGAFYASRQALTRATRLATSAGESCQLLDTSASLATGGFPNIPYLRSQPDPGVIAQQTEVYCGIACAQMIWADRGIHFSQDEIAEVTPIVPEFGGVDPRDLSHAMSELDPSHSWRAVMIMEDATAERDFYRFHQANGEEPWIAIMRAGGVHAVIIDGVDDLGNVMIRDPWPVGKAGQQTGERAIMDMNTFIQRYWLGIGIIHASP